MKRSVRANGRDDGFGMIEIIVSMAILVIMAVTVLPLFSNAVTTSANNSTRSTGIDLARSTIDSARRYSSCTGVSSLAGNSHSADQRGIQLQLLVTVGTCPTGVSVDAPGVITLHVQVKRTDTSEVLATADTLVLVTG